MSYHFTHHTARTQFGRTPAHWAAMKGNEACLHLLLEAGADMNAKERGPLGFTPAHVAAENGQEACLRLLLENGADINAKDRVLLLCIL